MSCATPPDIGTARKSASMEMWSGMKEQSSERHPVTHMHPLSSLEPEATVVTASAGISARVARRGSVLHCNPPVTNYRVKPNRWRMPSTSARPQPESASRAQETGQPWFLTIVSVVKSWGRKTCHHGSNRRLDKEVSAPRRPAPCRTHRPRHVQEITVTRTCHHNDTLDRNNNSTVVYGEVFTVGRGKVQETGCTTD